MLCLPFFFLMIMHAGNVWKWLVGPLCLFAAEIGYRVGFICCSERGRTKVTSLQLLPNQVCKINQDLADCSQEHPQMFVTDRR